MTPADGRRGGGRKKRPVPEIPFSVIERRFELVHFGASPAVGREDDGYYVRVLTGQTYAADAVRSNFDYFRLAADGTVKTAPRGHTPMYKPGRVTGMDEAVAKYATGGGS